MGILLSDGTDVFYRIFVKPSLLPTCSLGATLTGFVGLFKGRGTGSGHSLAPRDRDGGGVRADGKQVASGAPEWDSPGHNALLGVLELQLTLLRTGSRPICILRRGERLF